MSIRFLKIFLILLLINNLYAFDLFNNLKSKTQEVIKKSSNKSISNLKKKVSLNDILNADLTKIVNANIINIPGLFGLGIKCGLNKKVPVFDICKYLKPASTKLKINIGVCEVDMGLSSSCIVNLAQNLCKKTINQNIETPVKTIRGSYKNLETTGNIFLKKHSWSSKCGLLFAKNKKKIIKNPNGTTEEQIEKTYFVPAIINAYGLNAVNAKSIYDTNLLDWKRCIRLNAKPNDPFYALKKCSKLYKETMPKTEYDVDNAISDTIPFIDDGISDALDNAFKNVLIFQANYAQKCAKSNNPTQCENDLWNKGFQRADGTELQPKKLYNNQLDKIEKANARFYSILKEATRKKKEIIFLSQDFIDTLPIKQREEYLRKAKKVMYQKILNRYFLQQITNNEKELVSIEYDAKKVASTIFYPKQALNEINTLINRLNQK